MDAGHCSDIVSAYYVYANNKCEGYRETGTCVNTVEEEIEIEDHLIKEELDNFFDDRVDGNYCLQVIPKAEVDFDCENLISETVADQQQSEISQKYGEDKNRCIDILSDEGSKKQNNVRKSAQSGSGSDEATKSVGKIKCEFCNFSTNWKQSLINHVKLKHDDEAKWFKCKLCDHKCKRNCDLAKHVRYVHNKSELQIMKCYSCEYETKYRARLINHIIMYHSPHAEVFRCKFCKYTTKWKQGFRNHIKTLHNTNPIFHYCHLCSYKTIVKGYLTDHMKRKHKKPEKMFICECGLKLNVKNIDHKNSRRCTESIHYSSDNALLVQLE